VATQPAFVGPEPGLRLANGPRDAEEVELAALVGYAFDARGTSDYRARIGAIEDWHQRRYEREYERHRRSSAAVLQCLRECR